MTSLSLAALAAATFVGHFSLAVWIFNRLHAKPWPRKLIGALENVLLLSAALILLAYTWRYVADPTAIWEYPITSNSWPWQAYALVCRIVFGLVVPLWLLPKLFSRTPPALVAESTKTIDIAEKLGYPPVGARRVAIAAKFPGNQIFQVAVAHKTLALPRLPLALEQLTIAHLSDLHMTGKVTREFYEEIVDQTNALQPDLIAITGDIAETIGCIDWIEPILGRLKSRLGNFFVLGNHEMRLPDANVLRHALVAAGITDLGSRCHWLEVGGTRVLLAGNEMPWFGQRPNVEAFIDNEAPPDFRLLLSHTPDEFGWARRQNFDLMLAGHNHGGQIRLPFLGALIAPSRFGYRYAGGVYQEEPTVLHVSRGIGGLHSVRFNCAPELPLLTLTHAPATTARGFNSADAARQPVTESEMRSTANRSQSTQ
jgi:predicted MPP superfamily phosphohydrolase